MRSTFGESRGLVLAGACWCSLVWQASSFSSPVTPVLRRSAAPDQFQSSACRSARLRSAQGREGAVRALGMEMEGETTDEQVMQQFAINLEGHFKPNVGFMPHAFKVNGDFAAGKTRNTCSNINIDV